jgi:uncharacterized protein YecE (DUF72 family)
VQAIGSELGASFAKASRHEDEARVMQFAAYSPPQPTTRRAHSRQECEVGNPMSTTTKGTTKKPTPATAKVARLPPRLAATEVADPNPRVSTRVGLCGFTMAMEDYASHFSVVEVQQTFYQPPRDATMQRWLASTPRGFEFTLKAWQLVTHAASSPTYRRITRSLSPEERAHCGFFRESAIVDEGFARSLACARVLGATAMLFQCAASFTPDASNVERMRAFFRRTASMRPPGFRFLWEPRGPKWVAERALAWELCDELDLVHVVDPFVTPPRPRHAVYWRLHGIGGARHSYSDDELTRLSRMLADVAEARLDPAPAPYVMFNNLPRVGDAKRFVRVLA